MGACYWTTAKAASLEPGGALAQGEDKAKSWVQWGGIPSHQRNGVPVPERSNGHGAARGGGGGSQQSEAAASHRSLPDSSVPLVSPNGKTNSAFDMLLLALEKSGAPAPSPQGRHPGGGQRGENAEGRGDATEGKGELCGRWERKGGGGGGAL